VSEDKFLIKDS